MTENLYLPLNRDICKISVEKDLVIDLVKMLKLAKFDFEVERQHAKSSIAKFSTFMGLIEPQQSPAPSPRASGGLARRQVQQLKVYIANNVHQKILVNAMSNLVQLSPSHFSRAFKQTFGETPHHYILRRRVELVRNLLSSTGMPLREVAQCCGFSDQAHLCAIFKQFTGESPGAWRRDQQPEVSRRDNPSLVQRSNDTLARL